MSKQFAGASKRRKLNNPLRVQAKTLFLHRKPKRNALLDLSVQTCALHILFVPEMATSRMFEVNRPST